MRRAAGLALVAAVLVPASAGAGTARPPLALTATPAHLSLAGSGMSIVRVTNPGVSPVVVDVGRAGFSLDLRGRPRIVRRAHARAATGWLTVSPRHFVLGAGATRSLTVSSRLPPRAEPGDHDALVLLTTRPWARAGVALRMRIGVVVVVRAPGRLVRRLALGGLRARRGPRDRVLVLHLRNPGNVTESLGPGHVVLSLRRGGVEIRLRSAARELRPRTSGVVLFRYPEALRGRVTAIASIRAEPGRQAVRRTFRLKV